MRRAMRSRSCRLTRKQICAPSSAPWGDHSRASCCRDSTTRSGPRSDSRYLSANASRPSARGGRTSGSERRRRRNVVHPARPGDHLRRPRVNPRDRQRGPQRRVRRLGPTTRLRGRAIVFAAPGLQSARRSRDVPLATPHVVRVRALDLTRRDDLAPGRRGDRPAVRRRVRVELDVHRAPDQAAGRDRAAAHRAARQAVPGDAVGAAEGVAAARDRVAEPNESLGPRATARWRAPRRRWRHRGSTRGSGSRAIP